MVSIVPGVRHPDVNSFRHPMTECLTRAARTVRSLVRRANPRQTDHGITKQEAGRSTNVAVSQPATLIRAGDL